MMWFAVWSAIGSTRDQCYNIVGVRYVISVGVWVVDAPLNASSTHCPTPGRVIHLVLFIVPISALDITCTCVRVHVGTAQSSRQGRRQRRATELPWPAKPPDLRWYSLLATTTSTFTHSWRIQLSTCLSISYEPRILYQIIPRISLAKS
jgi:hypothetical protein